MKYLLIYAWLSFHRPDSQVDIRLPKLEQPGTDIYLSYETFYGSNSVSLPITQLFSLNNLGWIGADITLNINEQNHLTLTSRILYLKITNKCQL